MSRLIVFEGLDCTGKTTIAKGLAEKIGAVYNKMEQQSSYLGKDLLLNQMKDEKYNILPKLKNNDVIQDRYYFSILSYNLSIEGGNIILPPFRNPDIVFYLKTDHETRVDRWDKKGFPLTLENRCLGKQIERDFEKILSGYNVFSLDTTDKTVEQSVEELSKVLQAQEVIK